MASETICGSFVPNGPNEIDNALNEGGPWGFNVQHISTGLYRISCEPFYSKVGGAFVSLICGTNPSTTPGYSLYMGACDMTTEPRTHDIVVYDSSGNLADIPYAATQHIGFYIQAVY